MRSPGAKIQNILIRQILPLFFWQNFRFFSKILHKSLKISGQRTILSSSVISVGEAAQGLKKEPIHFHDLHVFGPEVDFERFEGVAVKQRKEHRFAGL